MLRFTCPIVLLLCLGVSWGITTTVQAQNLAASNASQSNTTVPPDWGIDSAEGAFVRDIRKGSLAERLGLRKFDLIVKIDGQIVLNDSYLSSLLAQHPLNEPISVLIYRLGKPIVLSAKSLPPDSSSTKTISRSGQETGIGVGSRSSVGMGSGFHVNPSEPPPANVVKALITKRETQVVLQSFPPQKVTVDFDSFNIGPAQSNQITGTDGQIRRRIPSLNSDSLYYHVTTHLTFHETYEGGVRYTYGYDAKFVVSVRYNEWQIIDY